MTIPGGRGIGVFWGTKGSCLLESSLLCTKVGRRLEQRIEENSVYHMESQEGLWAKTVRLLVDHLSVTFIPWTVKKEITFRQVKSSVGFYRVIETFMKFVSLSTSSDWNVVLLKAKIYRRGFPSRSVGLGRIPDLFSLLSKKGHSIFSSMETKGMEVGGYSDWMA